MFKKIPLPVLCLCSLVSVNDLKFSPIELHAGRNELTLENPGGQTHSIEIEWREGDENTTPGLSLRSNDSWIRLPDWTRETNAGSPNQRSSGWILCDKPSEGVHGVHSCDVERDLAIPHARLAFWLFKSAGASPLWAIDCE